MNLKLKELKGIPFNGPVVLVDYDTSTILTVQNPDKRDTYGPYKPVNTLMMEMEVVDIRAGYRFCTSELQYPAITIFLKNN